MLVLLSPAKSLDHESPLPTKKHSEPRLLDRSVELIDVLREKSVADVAQLMKISDELAALNAQRYLDFHTPFTPENARPALLAFDGDVYQGMHAAQRFDERDFTEAQKTIRILSGLYGVLRPLDLMQPYRLEMGTKLPTERGKDLYDFWGDTITERLAADLAESPGEATVVNLASNEYFGAVRPKQLDAPVVAPRFEDTNDKGQRKVISFFAKRARGAMAGWMVDQRVRKQSDLKGFDELGYRYDADASTEQVPVFVRSFEDRQAAN